MFSCPLFLSLLTLLAASLMACTYTTQIPLVKVARRWSFSHSAESISKQEFAETLPRASIQDLGVVLMGSGYEGVGLPVSKVMEFLLSHLWSNIASSSDEERLKY
ncbi:cytochrome c biogenesis protein CCS1, chloroplastic-like isoform X1 [Rhododendron vialii]|uniref:cytochrome c biogenesis protein CCS1, chloroplastic-like isoform X1 n=1 Tax=Rhododendron vialii TaxID=182163 RepID=UPI00265DD42B|nr:cytochrome c biogenesis protein CCS1, chloroplastic-like isoform X1 [Rhododendron vialii]